MTRKGKDLPPDGNGVHLEGADDAGIGGSRSTERSPSSLAGAERDEASTGWLRSSLDTASAAAPPDESVLRPGVLNSIWRHPWLVLMAGIAGVLAGLLVAYFQPPVYEANSLMRLADPETAGVFESQAEIGAEVYIARRQDLVTSRTVTERAAEILGPAVSASQVRQSITVEADPDLLTLEIRAQRPTASAAASFANTVAEAYQQIARERTFQEAEQVISELRAAESSLEGRIDAVEEQLEELLLELREAEVEALQERIAAEQQGVPLPAEPPTPVDPRTGLIVARLDNLVAQLIEIESRIREVSINAEVIGSGVETFEEAVVPDSPIAPRPLILAVMGGLLMMALAAAFAYWRAGQAAKVWSSMDAARILRAPLLGRLPAVRRSQPVHIPDDLDLSPPVTEAYQFLLNSIEYELTRLGGTSALITSAGPTDGKTSACVQLALAAGRAREREIVLVDGDLRTRSLSRLFGAVDRSGLSDLDSDHVTLEEVLVRRPITADVEVWIVPAGATTGDPSFLRSPTFREQLWQLRRGADLTIVDSAPLLAVADTTVLAGHVDGVILIVNARTPTSELERVKERLSFVPAPLLGYVYVGERAGRIGYYGYTETRKRRAHQRLGDRLRRGWRWLLATDDATPASQGERSYEEHEKVDRR
jgi:Mrp family chromosome partitioning ATPase/LPS O-antigen subunit length determinant protein (WzzB/FepE family)